MRDEVLHMPKSSPIPRGNAHAPFEAWQVKHPMTQADWTPEIQALWGKLEDLQLDHNHAVFDFSARLSKENGWPREFTARVIREYKRFLLLAMHAGHPVTPSVAVDQVWHLHLVYTRSYWQVLCGQILGRPLHHEPTRGGALEGRRYRDQYQRTLESYERLFGEQPPADIWTGVEQRFQPEVLRWVDVSRNWTLPRPQWLRRVSARQVAPAAALLVVALLLAGCDDLSVLDYRGGDFLVFYACGFGIALLASLVLAKVSAGLLSTPPRGEPLREPYLIAALGGGPQRVADAALAALFSRGMLEVHPQGRTHVMRRAAGGTTGRVHPVEERLLGALPQDLRSVRKVLAPAAEKLRTDLETAGFMLRSGQRTQIQLIAAVPLLLMMVVGVLKVVAGMERAKPVGFLVLGLLLTLLVMAVLLSKITRRTPAGQREWSRLRQPAAKAPHLTAATASSGQDTGSMAAMAVALAGTCALADAGYAPLYQALAARTSAASAGCGTSGCGASGCSDGGAGDGGGDGGGGCGGCGGGGD